jgi:hypothetical protein
MVVAVMIVVVIVERSGDGWGDCYANSCAMVVTGRNTSRHFRANITRALAFDLSVWRHDRVSLDSTPDMRMR